MVGTISGYIVRDGVSVPVYQVNVNVSAGQTDSALVTAVSGKSILVLSVVAVAGGTATTLVFNTKGSSTGVAISPLYANAANGVLPLQYNPHGHFVTNSGEGLTCNTGSGAATGMTITYAYIG